MKILHTTDLHFNKRWCEWINDQQPGYDAICITGDFLDSSKPEPLDTQMEWMSGWLRDFYKPVFVCSGNHDLEDWSGDGDWLGLIPNICSDNMIKTLDGIKFGCVPYVDPDFLEFGKCDVVLYHLPPARSETAIDRTTKADWGDKGLARVLNSGALAPKVLLCGHIHNPIKTTDIIKHTKIYNCGYAKNSPKVPLYSVVEI